MARLPSNTGQRAGLALALLAAVTTTQPSNAQQSGTTAAPIAQRNIGVSREAAARLPRSEGDQAVVEGWPLYRTERGQTAFNHAMATLSATDGPPPLAEAFKGCPDLHCNLRLPEAGRDGWVAPGRIWVSPTQYVLFAHSPRNRGTERRRSVMNMQVFVFHEFHNSSRNTDTFDTISSHSGGVFVPFYMSRQSTDAQGRTFVIIMQVAPLDVVSVHASNYGSAGPGIEIAKNASDALEPLQGAASILIASLVKAAVPRLQVVNHRGSEGQQALQAYARQQAAVRETPNAPPIALPFTPATRIHMATAAPHIDALLLRRGASPRLHIAERRFMPPPEALRVPKPSRMLVNVTTPEPMVPMPMMAPRPVGSAPKLLAPPRLVSRSTLLRDQPRT